MIIDGQTFVYSTVLTLHLILETCKHHFCFLLDWFRPLGKANQSDLSLFCESYSVFMHSQDHIWSIPLIDNDDVCFCLQVNTHVVTTALKRRKRMLWTAVWSAGPTQKTTQRAKIKRRKEKTRGCFAGANMWVYLGNIIIDSCLAWTLY